MMQEVSLIQDFFDYVTRNLYHSNKNNNQEIISQFAGGGDVFRSSCVSTFVTQYE